MMGLIHRVKCYLRREPNLESLIERGLSVGDGFQMMAGCTIDYSHCWLISIGSNVTFAPKVCILAHDASTKKHLGYTKIGIVSIEDNVFIGTGATILPGVTVGKNSIIGAGSVVSKDVPANTVFAGVPAKQVCTLDEFIERQTTSFNKGIVFNEEYTLRRNVSREKKQEMIETLLNSDDKSGFVE